MSRLVVHSLLFDDENVEKFARHGVTAEQVMQVMYNPRVMVRNRKSRRGKALLIGRDYGGACLTVPLEPTPDPGVWRPITAWRCKEHERYRLEQAHV